MSSNNRTIPTTTAGERRAVGVIMGISGAAFGFLVWLIYFKAPRETYSDFVAGLPAVNAALNALAATCLCAGYVAIRKKRVRVHMSFMITAFVFSALFLVSYIMYHNYQGDTRFEGTGPIRSVYFFILISHILCTLFALPMILTTFFFALTKRFEKHRRLARFTLPLWLYVSVTGVAIFFLLRAHS